MIETIQLKNISRTYSVNGFRLLIDNLEFQKGRIEIISGPNGSGKTTLLKLIALLESAEKGSIMFNRKEIRTGRNGFYPLRKNIGFLMQNPYLFNLDVFSNIALGLRLRGYAKDKIKDKVDRLLSRLKIDHLAGKNVHLLSAGEQQKVALAQVLVWQPEVILLDEPTANIDQESELLIEEIIKDIQAELQPLLIIATHSSAQIQNLGGRVNCLKKGRLN